MGDPNPSVQPSSSHHSSAPSIPTTPTAYPTSATAIPTSSSYTSQDYSQQYAHYHHYYHHYQQQGYNQPTVSPNKIYKTITSIFTKKISNCTQCIIFFCFSASCTASIDGTSNDCYAILSSTRTICSSPTRSTTGCCGRISTWLCASLCFRTSPTSTPTHSNRWSSSTTSTSSTRIQSPKSI